MKLNRAVTLGVSVSLASATAFDGITTGIGSPPPNMTYVDTDLGQLNSPNATNTVNFTFFGEQWALRVNVTELGHLYSNGTSSNSSGSLPHPHVVMSTFDLSWPNTTETLNQTAIRLNKQGHQHSAQSTHPTPSSGNSTDDPLCMFSVSSPVWSNVTNKHTDKRSSDCEDALGQQCIRRILSSMSGDTPGACSEPDLTEFEECQGVFRGGPTSPLDSFSISTPFEDEMIGETSMDHGDGVVDKVVRSLNQTLPGEMVHYRTTAPYTHANQTAVREAESAYRMVILTLGKVAEAVCMRVDPSIDDEDLSNIAQTPDSDGDGGSDDSLDDSSGSGDNSSNSGGDGDDNNKGGESAAGPQFPATMGSVAIAGLAAALFGLL